VLPVAFRAYIERVPPRKPSAKAPPDLGWPEHLLVLDTETTTDPTQRLMFGSWRYGHWGSAGEVVVLEEGLIYQDDLPTSDPAGWECLQAYARVHRPDHRNRRRPELLLLSRREFVNDRLWKALDGGALIVGYNLPFDLSRLAIRAGAARGPMFAGGFSIPLFDYEREAGEWRENPYRPRFRFKFLDSKRVLMGLSRRRGARPDEWLDHEQPGRFLDLKALVFVLTAKHLRLERAAETFDVAQARGGAARTHYRAVHRLQPPGCCPYDRGA
jgi:hypothetical protein